MATLPTPGGDLDTWGDEVNAFFLAHCNSDGSLKTIAARIMIPLGLPTSVLAVAEGLGAARIDSSLNGLSVTAVEASCVSPSTSGIPSLGIRRVRGAVGNELLSTNLTIDANEYDSSTAAVAAVINASFKVMQTGDFLIVDGDVAGTGTAGVIVTVTVV